MNRITQRVRVSPLLQGKQCRFGRSCRAFSLGFALLAAILSRPAIGAEPAAPGPATPAMTLADACRQAGSANPSILSARLRVEASIENRRAVRANFWPSLSLQERAARTDDPSLVSTMLARQGRTNLMSANESGELASEIAARWLFFDAGRRARESDAASGAVRSRNYEVDVVRGQILTQTAETFLDALRAMEEATLAAAETKRMEERLAIVQTRLAAGRGTDGDRLAAEYSVALARAEESAARTDERNARDRLGRLLGRAGTVTVPLTLGEENPLAAAAALREPDEAERHALAHSPDLSREQSEIEIRHAETRARVATLFPTLQAEAVGGRYQNDLVGRYRGQDYQLGVTLAWEIFDGGERRARIRQAEKMEEEARTRLEDLQRAIQVDVREAARSWRQAEVDVGVASARIAAELAESARRDVACENGSLTLYDQLEGRNRLANARLEHVRAICFAQRLAARLLQAAGYWPLWMEQQVRPKVVQENVASVETPCLRNSPAAPASAPVRNSSGPATSKTVAATPGNATAASLCKAYDSCASAIPSKCARRSGSGAGKSKTTSPAQASD